MSGLDNLIRDNGKPKNNLLKGDKEANKCTEYGKRHSMLMICEGCRSWCSCKHITEREGLGD